MPATIEEAFNDPYSITKKKYEASFFSQGSQHAGYGSQQSGYGSQGSKTDTISNQSIPSRTSSFIRNPNTQLNFGLTNTSSTLTSTPTTMPAAMPTSSTTATTAMPTSTSTFLPKLRSKKEKAKKHKKKHRRHQRGGNYFSQKIIPDKKYFLFLINVIFGLIIIFSFALCNKYF